jgi:hypothetical protein
MPVINHDFVRLIDFLKSIASGKIHKSEKQIRYNLAQSIAAIIRAKYRVYESEPSQTERMAIEAGKDKGAVRPMRPGRQPINVFALLGTDKIGVTPYIVPGGYKVGANPAMTVPGYSGPRKSGHDFPGGVPLELMAYWLEYPKPIIVRMTLRQLGYLYAVREGRAGPGRRKRQPPKHHPDATTAHSYVMLAPQRPVWQSVFKELTKIADRKYGKPLLDMLNREAPRYGLIPRR